jgi:hypothetical protein
MPRHKAFKRTRINSANRLRRQQEEIARKGTTTIFAKLRAENRNLKSELTRVTKMYNATMSSINALDNKWNLIKFFFRALFTKALKVPEKTTVEAPQP